MICIIALIVFGILGIFSASHRKIAAEAFDCVFRRVTLRPCTSGLDKRLKAQITGGFLRKTPWLGKQIYKYFEIISWVFLILMLLSIYFTGQAVYNYAMYGNCNGPNSDQFCIFDPFATHDTSNSTVCSATGLYDESVLVLPEHIKGYSIGLESYKHHIIEFGCYSCPYTKKSFEAVRKVLQNHEGEVYFTFVDSPLPIHNFSYKIAEFSQCVNILNKDAYWPLHASIMEHKDDVNYEWLYNQSTTYGVKKEDIEQCIQSGVGMKKLNESIALGKEANIFGTPTFFVDGKALVGPQDYKTFEDLLR